MTPLLSPEWHWPLVCAALTVVLVARHAGRGVLGLHAAIFLVLALGPVVTHLRGNEVYEGILLDHLSRATSGFALALLGLLLADLLAPQRSFVGSVVDLRRPDRWTAVFTVLAVPLTAYAVVTALRLGPDALSAEKASRIAGAGSFHYPFLSLAVVALAAWPLVRPARAAWVPYGCLLVAYVGYCILTQERDFVFVLLALAFLSRLTQVGSRITRVLVAAMAAVFAVSALSTGRSAADDDQPGALFEGSLLFVDTRVIEYVPASLPHQHGSTYVEAAAAALTRGHLGGSSSPTAWLVEMYAPGSTSGYGFSMTGEALMNFGTLGILPVFLVLGLVVNLVVNRMDRSPFLAHLGYFLTMFVPYMFRSDSRGLLSGVATCLVIHGGLALFSRPTPTDGEASAHAPAGGHRGTAVPRA